MATKEIFAGDLVDEQGHYVVKSAALWKRWRSAEVLNVEEWKSGVKRLHVRDLDGTPSFYLIYCPDEYLPPADIPRYAPQG